MVASYAATPRLLLKRGDATQLFLGLARNGWWLSYLAMKQPARVLQGRVRRRPLPRSIRSQLRCVPRPCITLPPLAESSMKDPRIPGTACGRHQQANGSHEKNHNLQASDRSALAR